MAGEERTDREAVDANILYYQSKYIGGLEARILVVSEVLRAPHTVMA